MAVVTVWGQGRPRDFGTQAGERFKWDGRPRYSPPVVSVQFPPLPTDQQVDPVFHKRYRSKVGFVAHIAVQTRVDVMQHAVKAARRLNDPVAECEQYIDQVLQYVFSTMEQKLTYTCTLPLQQTLLMASDAALADTQLTTAQVSGVRVIWPRYCQ